MAKAKPVVGYSGKSLADKLGLKADMTMHFIHAPHDYFTWIGISPPVKKVVSPPWDYIHLFTNSLEELEEQLYHLKNTLQPNGMIWVSWYKKSSGLSTQITEDLIRETCLPLGLVDVKVCAVSEEWSGLKLVIRKELRKTEVA